MVTLGVNYLSNAEMAYRSHYCHLCLGVCQKFPGRQLKRHFSESVHNL